MRLRRLFPANDLCSEDTRIFAPFKATVATGTRRAFVKLKVPNPNRRLSYSISREPQ